MLHAIVNEMHVKQIQLKIDNCINMNKMTYYKQTNIIAVYYIAVLNTLIE